MNKCLSNLDSRADKQRFLEANHAAFMIPKKFDAAAYQNKIEEVRIFSLSIDGNVRPPAYLKARSAISRGHTTQRKH